MTDKIVSFPDKTSSKVRRPMQIADVELIGFLTKDDRDIWVDKKSDLMKIMKFIVSEKITLTEGDKKKPKA